MATISETAALDRLVDSLSRCLNPETARRIVEFKADQQLQSRLDELADKSTEGDLNDSERAEYETYVRAIDFITILQLKARRILGESLN